jgi:hypothetical protein
MAIGDEIAVLIGTGAGNRQPSSGVEECIRSIVKPGTSDHVLIRDGTTDQELIQLSAVTNVAEGTAGATRNQTYNMAVMTTNSLYIGKAGTTDRIYLGGVQTNA